MCTDKILSLSLAQLCRVDLPTKLNVFVDAGGDAHGDYGIIPGTDKHERQAQAHTQK